MNNHVDRLNAALIVLAGHGHIKQRLIKAYEDHLADIDEDELPVTMKQAFADFRHMMHRVLPLNGEGPVCASVRKMSVDEASDCAAQVVDFYGEIARLRDDVAGTLPLDESASVRVPPFLVKSN
ncbi:MAG: hypothetical protein ACR2QI_07335 [Woeseiaceae bacterium]